MNNTTATVSVLDDALDVAIHEEVPESIEVFAALDVRTRERLAVDAWRIGLRAMSVAQAQAHAAQLGDLGRNLAADIERHLGNHLAAQERGLTDALRQYFDPNDGRVAERLDAVLGDRGALAGLLEKFVGPSGVLAETMARHVGAQSALFKLLSPTDAMGLVKVIEGKIGEVLARSQAELTRALDPLASDGALAKLLRQLREEITQAGKGQAEKLQAALATLDANDERSAISRLLRETTRARADLLAALNPRDPSSPLAAIEAAVKELLDRQAVTLGKFQDEVRQRQEELDKAVREGMARLETRRAAAMRSPDGGRVFEAALTAFVSERLGHAPVQIEETGTTVGVRGARKVGDLVVRHTAEGAFAGAALVIEGKHEKGYTVGKALAELDEARDNRKASAGLLVMAASHALPSFPRLARHGQNVLVIWDPDDPATDARLEAALLLGLYLVSRIPTADAGDRQALADVEKRILAELERVERLEKHNGKIQTGSEGIESELRKARKELHALLDKTKSTLRALAVELDEEAERQAPLSVPLSESSDILQ